VAICLVADLSATIRSSPGLKDRVDRREPRDVFELVDHVAVVKTEWFGQVRGRDVGMAGIRLSVIMRSNAPYETLQQRALPQAVSRCITGTRTYVLKGA
jgi:hypothetical protein